MGHSPSYRTHEECVAYPKGGWDPDMTFAIFAGGTMAISLVVCVCMLAFA